MKIILPWPPSILSPNYVAHWAAKSKAKKKYKSDCYFSAKYHPAPIFRDGENIPLKLIFHPPNKRRHDADNLLARSKHLIDGLALAWGVNDLRFRPITIDFGDIVKHGAVEVIVG